MYRRIVALILLPCLLLTQSVAALGHLHVGNQPVGHDLRPHFHTNLASSRHDHGHHHHGPDRHHHDQHDDGGAPAEPDSQAAQQPGPLSGSEHDSDAVFVDGVNVVFKTRSVANDDELAASLLWPTAGSFLSISLLTDPSQKVLNWAHLPPLLGSGCPLYLRKLTLLI